MTHFNSDRFNKSNLIQVWLARIILFYTRSKKTQMKKVTFPIQLVLQKKFAFRSHRFICHIHLIPIVAGLTLKCTKKIEPKTGVIKHDFLFCAKLIIHTNSLDAQSSS